MNTGMLIAIIVLALGALGGIGYGIWYAVSGGSGSPSTPSASGPSSEAPLSEASPKQQPPASFAKTSQ